MEKYRQYRPARLQIIGLHYRKSVAELAMMAILLYAIGIPRLLNIAENFEDLYDRSMHMYGEGSLVVILAEILILFFFFNPFFSSGLSELLFMEPAWTAGNILIDLLVCFQVLLLPLDIILLSKCSGYLLLWFMLKLQILVMAGLFYFLLSMTGNPLIVVMVCFVYFFGNVSARDPSPVYILIKKTAVEALYTPAYIILYLILMLLLYLLGRMAEKKKR